MPGLASLLLLVGCASPPGGFNSPEPAARLHAAVQAAQDQNQAAIPDLIRLLESDDPAVRLVSIRTLDRLTGQTQGYDYAAPERQRRLAIERWTAWQQAREAGSAAVPAPHESPGFRPAPPAADNPQKATEPGSERPGGS